MVKNFVCLNNITTNEKQDLGIRINIWNVGCNVLEVRMITSSFRSRNLIAIVQQHVTFDKCLEL